MMINDIWPESEFQINKPWPVNALKMGRLLLLTPGLGGPCGSPRNLCCPSPKALMRGRPRSLRCPLWPYLLHLALLRTGDIAQASSSHPVGLEGKMWRARARKGGICSLGFALEGQFTTPLLLPLKAL